MRPTALDRIGDGWKNRCGMRILVRGYSRRGNDRPVGEMHPFLEQWMARMFLSIELNRTGYQYTGYHVVSSSEYFLS